MFCNNCGAELSADTKFCPSCGTSITGVNPQAQQPTPVVVQIQQPSRPIDNRKGPGPGIAGFIIGLLSLFVCWIPIVGFFPALIAFILGIAGASKKRRKRGFGIWGIVLSVISILVCALITFGLLGSVGLAYYDSYF